MLLRLERVMRGGGWLLGPDGMRTWTRRPELVTGTSNSIGCRCAHSLREGAASRE